ncbi:MAG: hypothetical protein HWN67_00435 [Candidatus Helarchaeota archaeon]|nr:hypothetical protein [Candidatus Helarchaeota archaeon]
MNIYEILDYNIKSLNNDYLISSIIRSSIVLTFGLISLIILYYVLPQKIEKIKTENLTSLSKKESIPLILGMIGFFILGTTGYAYAISRLLNILYTPLEKIWICISFILITAICIYCYKNIKFGIVPIIIGWIGAIGGIFSIFLGDVNLILALLIEIFILSFLISVGIWFLHFEKSNYAYKIILPFGCLLIFYGGSKLLYFLFSTVEFLRFLFNLSPTFLDIICIFGPVTICFLKCRNS